VKRIRVAPGRLYQGMGSGVAHRGGAARGRGVVVVAAGTLVVAGAGFVLLPRLAAPLSRALAALPLWSAPVQVAGNEYLSSEEVRKAARLEERASFWRVDLEAVRARLVQRPRIRDARVTRRLDGAVRIEIDDRLPVALLPLSRLTEVDRDGRALPALARGAVPELPVVRGLGAPKKGKVSAADLGRALRWIEALGASEVGLGDRISEVDVSSGERTEVVLAPDGVRLLLPAEPDRRESLAALRVVLADLEAKGRIAETIDCRAEGVAVVQPAPERAPVVREGGSTAEQPADAGAM
jgi:hypothetical protein